MKYLKSIQRCAKYVAKRPQNISIMVEEVVQVVEPSLGVRLNQLKGKTERNHLYQGILLHLSENKNYIIIPCILPFLGVVASDTFAIVSKIVGKKKSRFAMSTN